MSLLALGLLLTLACARSVLPSLPPASWSGPHIADLSVLLPPRMTNPVHYRLVGSGGCFIWTWDHHDILTVQPEYDDSGGCSTSARLTSIGTYSGRKETAVYAADSNTGIVTRCEVFIDKIARIQILHHSVKLDLGGLTELRIRAFDDNVGDSAQLVYITNYCYQCCRKYISSLVGLRFKWTLIPDANDRGNVRHHLAHVPLMESPLTDCGGFCGDLDTQIKLEESGVGSDLYVVKGLEIGHEIVTAQILEPLSENVTDNIAVTVAEMMSLDPPSPIFVIIDALVVYKLKVIRQNMPKAIDFPSPYHRWSVSNGTVAVVDILRGVVTASSLGVTDVIVEDIRVLGHRQISVMHVVIPERMCLYIKPVTNALVPSVGDHGYLSSDVWYLVAGQQYIVHLKVFSHKYEEKEIYLTENNVVKLESDIFTNLSLVSVDEQSQYVRQNSRLLKPSVEGQGTLSASLSYRRASGVNTEFLKAEQLVTVCKKISVHLEKRDMLIEVIRLPWAPGLHQGLELIASGGCARAAKDYKWFSSNEAIASVSASGVLRAERPGQALIKVVSAYDIFNYAEVVIEVSVPSSMVMLPYFPVETIVGTEFQAAITLNPSDGSFYHKCDTFCSAIRWKVFSESECFRVTSAATHQGLKVPSQIDGSDTSQSSPCSWISIYASCPGHASLHATFSSEMAPSYHLSSGQTVLQASKLIASYAPLLARQAGDGNQFGGYWVDMGKVHAAADDGVLENLAALYLVPGTTIDILVLGGPERWGQGVEFIDSSDVIGYDDGEKDVLLKHTSTNGVRIFTVSCQTIGDFILIFSRGNLMGPNHFLPAIEKLELPLVCSFPSSITLIVNQFANTHEVIQSSLQEPRGPGNIHLSPISVVNGQTVRLAAVGIHSSGRAFANSSSLHLRWDLRECDEMAHWKATSNLDSFSTKWERLLVLQNATGQCGIRASVIGLSENVAALLSAKAYMFFQSTAINITDAINLQLISLLRVLPEIAVLVFDPEAKINMSITGGTCFLQTVLNGTEVVEILPYHGLAECSWLMLAARRLGTSLLTIYDKGLSPPASTAALVKVSSVEWIKVISEDLIFMLEGTSRYFNILAGTHDGSTFDYSQYLYMNIHLHTDGAILKILEDGSTKNGDFRLYHPHFEVKATNIGISTLYVSVRGHSGNWIMSQQISVDVYPEFRVHPDYVFLAPGAAYMIVAKGGPTTAAFIEFTCLDPDVAIVNRSSGLLSAISYGNTSVRVASYGSDGSLICESFGRVEIGVPPEMVLSSQSEQLCIGCLLPIFPSYPEGNLFSFYEVCKDYKWSIEDDKVLNFLSSRLHDNVVRQSSIGDNCSHYCNDNGLRFINILSGRSSGSTRVSVSFSCVFISTGTHLVMSYSASRVLRVVPDPPLGLGIPITWVLPPYYTTSDLLPEFTDSSGLDSRLRKNAVIYSVLKSCGIDNTILEDPITVIGSKIKTKESNTLGCLQAKDQSGRTEVACCIRVADVSQVRITSRELPYHIVHLGLNDQLELNIIYYDYLGYPFIEAHGVASLEIEINYPNVVSLHMHSKTEDNKYGKRHFYLLAQKHGRALVKLFFKESPLKAAYILVLVGARLSPQNPVLHVGASLNFSIDGNGALEGRWLSTNESVLSINSFTGEAYTHAMGSSIVCFESSSMKLKTTVEVLEDEQIQVRAPAELMANVHFPSDGYRFPLEFRGNLTYKYSLAGADVDEIYDCWVEPSFVGYAEPWRDDDSGVFYCVFFPYSPKNLVGFVSKLNAPGSSTSNGSGLIRVSIIASLRKAQHIRGSAQTFIVGGFSVSLDRLDLKSERNSSRIVVTGNTDVQINWSRKDLLAVIPVLKKDLGVAAHAEYEIQVLKRKSFEDKISIFLPTTGQSVELDVSYDPGDERATTRSSATWAAMIACMLMLVWTIVVSFKFLDRPESSPVVEQQVQSAAPAVFGSPISMLPPAGGTPSPVRTPQPLVEYVRRTIDETPYYKRGGRRLFDPRNSY